MGSAIKVLLVEDDDLLARMYDLALTEQGFLVEIARDGTIVFETVRMNQPDIVLMDVMMPNFNGLDTLKEIKKNLATSRIPVVMLSAYSDEEFVRTALKNGAARYLLKHNTEPQQIATLIRQLVTENNASHPMT